MATFTTEQLTQRWEDQRALKNLMGKYANCVILNREQDIFDLFWTARRGRLPDASTTAPMWAPRPSRPTMRPAATATRWWPRLHAEAFPRAAGRQERGGDLRRGPLQGQAHGLPCHRGGRLTARPPRACGTARAPTTTWRPAALWPTGPGVISPPTSSAPRTAGRSGTCSYTQRCGLHLRPELGQGAAAAVPTCLSSPPWANFHYPEYTVSKTSSAPFTPPTRPHHPRCPEIPEPYNTFADTFSYGI